MRELGPATPIRFSDGRNGQYHWDQSNKTQHAQPRAAEQRESDSGSQH